VQTCPAVRERATQTLQWAEPEDDLLAMDLDHLTLARLGLMLWKLDAAFHHRSQHPTLHSDMASHLEVALLGLRQANIVELVVGGLLTRAEWRAWLSDEDGAKADLREVEAVGRRGGMRLQLADLHLLRARLDVARNPPLARAHLAQAAALVADTGYHRRDAEIATLEHLLFARTA
jgi:hypothetical protein